jgi:hypothetical protein
VRPDALGNLSPAYLTEVTAFVAKGNDYQSVQRQSYREQLF